MAVVVTCKSGDDLEYVWTNQPDGPAVRDETGYYIDAPDAEAPGRWWFGPRAGDALGLAAGQRVEKSAYLAVYKQVNPLTGEKMGSSPGNYAKFEENLARKLEAEPHATEARKQELRAEAHKETRVGYPFTDVTVSFSKDVSLLAAGIRENLRQAKDAGDAAGQAYWADCLARYQECLQEGNRAAIEYLQTWAGITRTGHHGTRVDGKEPGKFEDAGLIVSSWLQGTSRAGDPQEHIHNQVARVARTLADGKMRAKDSVALRAALPGMAAVASVHSEAALAREFGLDFRPRADGRGMRIAGTPQWLEEMFSSRTVSIDDRMPEAIAAWSRRHDGAQPNEAQVFAIRQQVTLLSRESKTDGAIDWDAHAQEWDARSNGALAQFPAQVSNMRGPGGAGATRNTRNPAGPPERTAQAQAARDALDTVQSSKSAWTRAELLKAIGATMPPESRQMEPGAAVRMLERMADDILASAHGDVVCLESPEFLTFPESMRRGPDRRTVYERPGAARYATSAHLDAEHSLVSNAQRVGGWRMDAERAASLLGATVAELEAALVSRSAEAGQERTTTGLRMDQAAALFHALTNARTATVLTGPAGSGKSWSLGAAARAAIDAGASEVWGVSASQQAANVLSDAGHAAGVEIKAFNSHQFLGVTPGQPTDAGTPKDVRPGSVILIDEGSMLGLDHMLGVLRKATAVGAKVIIAGDQEQLSAVSLGGAMKLLSQRLGYVKLAEPVRFESSWERDATLRLRDGDDTVLEEYDAQGRFRAGTADQMMDAAARAYVANALQGIHTRLIAMDWQRCRELSRRVRDDLKDLSIVQDGPVINLSDGAQASVGDLIISRKVDHDARLANGDVLRVESVNAGRAVLRKVTGRNAVTGGMVLADDTISYADFSEFNLAYAATGHAAQGDTVTEGIAYVTGHEPRNWLYVAMSRGARTNHAFVTTRPETADVAPGTVAAPELARHKRVERLRAGALPGQAKASESDRHHIAVLADVLERDATEESASEILRRNLANADHLGILHTYWQSETIEARKGAYAMLTRELLPDEHKEAAFAPTAEWLFRTLRQAEICGQDARQLVDRAIKAGNLNSARDVASVLNHRISGYVAGMAPSVRKWSDQVPAVADADMQTFLVELAEAMDVRAERLGEFAADRAPAFLTEHIGQVPANPAERVEWERKASAVMAYREVYNYQREDDAIGSEPSMASPEKHALWQAAYEATGSPGAEDLGDVSDAQLRARAAMYQRETSWAPRYATDELREARVAMRDAHDGMTRAAAEADAARDHGDGLRASEHGRLHASYEALAERYRAAKPVLVAAVEDYDNWLTVTETSRRMAVAADAELRRRYPEDKLPPLRSAEPEPVTAAEHDELAGQDDQPAWLVRMAEQSRAYREGQADREAQVVPHDDHELGDESMAWRTDLDRERDAVIHAAPVEIGPAETVIKSADLGLEAGR